MSSEILQKVLSKFNVWEKHIEEFKCKNGNYRLPKDERALACLKKEMPSLYKAIQFDFLPDPVSGDIDAPICMILNNPGVAAIDRYNYCCIDDSVKNDIRSNLFKTNRVEVTFNYEGSCECMQLKKRRNVLLEQYYLKPGTSPYALDDSFNSITLKPAKGRKGMMPKCGSFLWTKALFARRDINEARRISKKVFDLEFFPYHTKSFQMAKYIEYEKRHRNGCEMIAHSQLRNELIKAFAAEKRLFVVRSEHVRKFLCKELNVDSQLIVMFNSARAVSLTRGNLNCPCEECRQRLFNILELN